MTAPVPPTGHQPGYPALPQQHMPPYVQPGIRPSPKRVVASFVASLMLFGVWIGLYEWGHPTTSILGVHLTVDRLSTVGHIFEYVAGIGALGMLILGIVRLTLSRR